MNRSPCKTALFLVALLVVTALPSTTAAVGGKAADFTLRDIDGQHVSLGDYLGEKVIVLHFWTACCASGQAVMPHLKTLHEELADSGVVVLAVSVDAARNEPRVKGFVRAGSYPFTVLLDQSTEVVTIYDPRQVVPFTVVIGRDGQIYATFEAYAPGDEVRLRETLVGIVGGDGVKESELAVDETTIQ